MQFRTEDVDEILVVTAPNMSLDASNADEFKRQVVSLVEGRSRVAMNLSEIGFMDSAGIGAVLAVYKKVRSEGGQFRVFGLNQEVKALFDLVRMQRLFDIREDQESAVRAFSA